LDFRELPDFGGEIVEAFALYRAERETAGAGEG
jgi:hypothetical protein